MSSPTAATRSGYEFRFLNTAANTYTATLSKWVSGTRTVLASKTGYGFVDGNSLALLDVGSTVSAWTDTGSGFNQILSAEDALYSSGYAGLEGSGNITGLTNFKAGVPGPISGMNGALSSLEPRDSLARYENPLSSGGSWEALSWDTASTSKTGYAETGWGPYEAFPTVNGAYWAKSSFTDSGSGVAVAATQRKNPTIAGRYFSLWLDMAKPASAKSGYELPSESSFALVAKGGTVSAWTRTSPWSRALI